MNKLNLSRNLLLIFSLALTHASTVSAQSCVHTVGINHALSTPTYKFNNLAGIRVIIESARGYSGGSHVYPVGLEIPNVESGLIFDTSGKAKKGLGSFFGLSSSKKQIPTSLPAETGPVNVEANLDWGMPHLNGYQPVLITDSSRSYLLNLIGANRFEIWTAQDLFAGPKLLDLKSALKLGGEAKEYRSENYEVVEKIDHLVSYGSESIFLFYKLAGRTIWSGTAWATPLSIRHVLIKVNPATNTVEQVVNFDKTEVTSSKIETDTGYPGFMKYEQSVFNNKGLIDRSMSRSSDGKSIVISSRFLNGDDAGPVVVIPIRQ